MSDDLSIPNQVYSGSRAGGYGAGRRRVRPSMDPDTRRLVMFAGGLGTILVMLIGTSALMGRRSAEIPVIAADTRPIRVKPENPGGMKVAGADNDVFSAGSDTANSKLSAAPENPDTKAFRSVEAPVAATPAPLTATAPVTKPAAAVAAATPQAAKPPVSAAAPAAKPTATKPAAAVADSRSAVSGRQAVVQLAALSSEEAARNEWQLLSKRMPDLMSGRQPIYSRTERDGHTYWRVRTTGFADVAQARTFCEHVRTKGGGCSVTDF